MRKKLVDPPESIQAIGQSFPIQWKGKVLPLYIQAVQTFKTLLQK